MVMQVRRTLTVGATPTGLAEGQISVGMADQPPTAWVGVPASVNPAGVIPITGLVRTVAGAPQPAGALGQLWWDGAQLYVYTGSEWVIAVNTFGGLSVTFPASPAANQVVTDSSTGATWRWDAPTTRWVSGTTDAPSDNELYGRIDGTWSRLTSSYSSGPTPPAAPNNGDLWFDTNTHQLMVYQSGSWVPASDTDVSGYLPLTGGVLTGWLGVNNTVGVAGDSPQIWLSEVQTFSAAPMTLGSRMNGAYRWTVNLGNGAAELGGDSGSDFVINRHSDTGAFLGTALSIERATGKLSLGSLAQGVPTTGTQTLFGCSPGAYGIIVRNNAAGTNYAVGFQNNVGTFVGTIVPTDTATAFNTTSDRRLKAVGDEAFEDGRKILDQLPVRLFSWLANRRLGVGLMAQDAQAAYPAAVTAGRGEPGDPDYVPWAVDYSKYVPVLIQALQEAFRRIDELEAKVAT